MLSVYGTYDGKQLQLAENVDIQSPQKVIVIFLDEDELSSEEMHRMAQQGKALRFLEEDEDLYSDDDLKIRYR